MSVLKYGKYIDIFLLKKMWVAFALQKLLTFCSKTINVFENTLVTTVNEFVIN